VSTKRSKPAKAQNTVLQQNSASQQQAVIHQFSGPIPPPAVLREYNLILPDAANRIIKMAEDEAGHRRRIEYKALTGDIWEGRIGQFLAFLIGIFTIGCGTYSAINGAELAGGIIGVGGVGSLVAAFIWGRKKPK